MSRMLKSLKFHDLISGGGGVLEKSEYDPPKTLCTWCRLVFVSCDSVSVKLVIPNLRDANMNSKCRKSISLQKRF